MKCHYIAPWTKVIDVVAMENEILQGSQVMSVYDCEPQVKRNSATLCPYNDKWCYDKQIQFNKWRASVKYLAKTRKKQTFITDGNNVCPNGFTHLCASCKQKQY